MMGVQRAAHAGRSTEAQERANHAIIRRLLWSRGLRAFADGYVSLLLPAYLIALGMSALDVGVIATATLLGSGVLTLLIGLQAYRFRYRSLLLIAAALMAATGLGFAAFTDFWPLLLIACVGTLNPSSGDVSVFLPLEHAVMSRHVKDSERTAVFARYGLTGSLIGALGALCAGVPELLVSKASVDMKTALQGMFVMYAVIGVGAASIYAGLPGESNTESHAAIAPLRKSKSMVYKLAALFSIDSFGGGLVLQSMVALWLFQRFELSTAVAGTIFLWTGILSAFSYLVAVRIARRIGLVNTMVFTHLPSSIFLILVPFMPSLGWAIAMLLARSALSQMDVPTRNSYVMAIVPPEERPAAASITAVPRSLASAAAPVLSGYLLTVSSFGLPLVLAGALKITYDLLLLRTCRNVRPPEETPGR